MKNNNGLKNSIYNIWLWVEFVLIVFGVYLPISLGIDRLSRSTIITLAFDWLGMFILLVILISCIRGRKSNRSDWFKNLTIVTFGVLFFEVIVWSVDGLADYRILNYLGNIGNNTLMLINSVCYYRFMCASLEVDMNWKSPFFRSIKVMAGLGIVAEVLNYWFGYFYVVDESGTYIRSVVGSELGYIPFLYIFGCTCFVVIKQKISLRKKWSYMSYVIIPLLVSFWYSITGMPPTLYTAALFGLLIIYGNIFVSQGHDMERTLLEDAKKDAELAWQRNQLTRSQIRPHFIFNCIGSIEQLCRTDSEKARNALHHFARYLRVNMDAMSKQSLISFANELEHIHNYVWLEQMRFEAALQYEENIETTEFSVPPLSVQPLVENAIKHGMMGKEDGALKVSISVSETEGYFEIKIEDNGNGFDVNSTPDDGRSHVGIQNVRDSLANMVDGELMITSRLGQGTIAVILIPKKQAGMKEK